jgi:hypothetical protein
MFYLLLLIFSIPLFSSECQDMRLDSKGQVMEKIDHKDQGELGICYSYAGAALFDAYRVQQGDKFKYQSSPIAAAALLVEKNISGSNLFTEGGHTCDVVNFLMKNGPCSDNHVALEKLSPQRRREYLENLASIFNNFQLSQVSNQCLWDKSHENLNDFKKIKKFLEEKNLSDFIKKVISQKCSSHPPTTQVSPLQCLTYPFPWQRAPDMEQYIHKTQQQLAQKKMPVGVNFCAQLLTSSPGYKGLEKNENTGAITRKKECDPHAAMIIGMRKIQVPPGGLGPRVRCQYLIRNSWNKEFNYSSSWESDKNGNLWVDEEALFNNTESLSYIGEL